MNGGIRYSRKLAILCATSICASCLAAGLRYYNNSRWLAAKRGAAGVERALKHQIGELSGFEDSNLRTLHAKVGEFRGQLGSEDLGDQLSRQFGRDWIIRFGGKEEWSQYSTQVVTLVRRSSSIADWPRIVDAVRDAERLPGVRVVSFEMRTSGNNDRRSVDVVRLVTMIYCHLQNNHRER